MSEKGLGYIPVAKIRENPSALRQVNLEDDGFKELVDNVREVGILNPIVVRPMTDAQTGEEYYGLVDGLHRYTAAIQAGLEEVPVQYMPMDDLKALHRQIMGNIHKIETKPVQYSDHLRRIMAMDHTVTSASLAHSLNKSINWLNERLGLLKLDPKIGPLVDEGKITLSNGYSLAKLPPEEQVNFIERAMTMAPDEFTATVQARKKDLDKAKREGRDASPEVFKPIAKFQKMRTLEEEITNPTMGPKLCEKLESPLEGFLAGVKYAIQLDEFSVLAAKRKDDERKKQAAEKKAKSTEERVKMRAEDAEVKAQRLKLEADAMVNGKDVKAILKDFDDKHGLVDGKKPAKKKEESVETVSA